MKLQIIYAVLSMMVLSSCTDFELKDLGFALQPIDGYVAFANDGGAITPIEIEMDEDDDEIRELRIECATGTLSDITVAFSFSGSAVLGSDFLVTSAGATVTATGGTILLKKQTDPAGVNDFDFVNLSIQSLTDDLTDGDKTLMITLESAVNADGKVFSVGRGGAGTTVHLKSASIKFVDVD
jgi:hypothetical protein